MEYVVALRTDRSVTLVPSIAVHSNTSTNDVESAVAIRCWRGKSSANASSIARSSIIVMPNVTVVRSTSTYSDSRTRRAYRDSSVSARPGGGATEYRESSNVDASHSQ